MLYWLLKQVLIGPLLKVVWRPRVQGLDNIPVEGPVILASNHLSFSDSFFLPVCVPRRVTFLAKTEYFTSPGVKGRFSRLFFSSVGQVPVDRRDAGAAMAGMRTGLRILAAGEVLGIYPEGTRSPDGQLYRGKTGVARLALQSGAVVVPCAMINTNKIQPTGRRVPHLRPRPRIRIGTALDFSAYADRVGERVLERSLTDEIMAELMRLSGQRYVDKYAADVKRASGANLGFGARARPVVSRPVHRPATNRPMAQADTDRADDQFPDRRAS